MIGRSELTEEAWGVATRSETRAVTYRAMVVLASIIPWLEA